MAGDSMTDTITIRVRAFAGVRDALGFGETTLALPAGCAVSAAIARLAADHPAAGLAGRRMTFAVNRNYAAPDRVLAAGDELALIPPVSGGAGQAPKLFEIVERPLSLDEIAGRVAAVDRGAITCFAGTVRGVTRSARPEGQQTDYLVYEAYADMAEPVLEEIAAEAQTRWPAIAAVGIMHRVGRLEVGDISIVIAVAAAHRRDTFDACHYIIDRVKEIAPIWKREVGPTGAYWVEGPLHG
jgi:molybdopterin synthase catalytic subunit